MCGAGEAGEATRGGIRESISEDVSAERGDARARDGGGQSLSEMEVFPCNKHKDSQIPLEISHNYGGSFELSPSVILLVDDDPDVRSLTRTFLEHEGYSVFSSGDAERAAQIFRSVPQIDLVVTDVYMPGRSGMELARELKARRSEMPVLLISGGVLEGGQEARLQAEGWSFLAKPFRLPELLATVHRILAPVEARRWREAKQGVSLDGLLARRLE
jgi:two-component system, chemotaxis family, chemotaxis protein CheY